MRVIKQGVPYKPTTDGFPWKPGTHYRDTVTGDVFYVESVGIYHLVIDHPRLNAPGWPVRVVRGSMDSTYKPL